MPASFLTLVSSALIEAQKGGASSKSATLLKDIAPEDEEQEQEQEQENQLDKGRCQPLS